MKGWIRLERCKFAVANLVVITVAGLLVVACDGIGWTGQRVIHESPSGFYLGAFISTATQPSPNREAIGIISEEFDAHVLLSDQHYAGIVAVDGTTLSGTLTEYRGRQGVFLGFDGISTISLNGEVSERDGMFGNYSGEDDEGRFALTYSDAYEDGSSLDLLTGIWSYSQASSGGAIYTITLDLDDSGRLFASDTAGCIFGGQLAIFDARFCAYSAAISVSSCGEVDGEYSGLVFYPIGGAADLLYLGTDNGLFAFANQFQRL